MKQNVLLDTGPLIAYFNRREIHHQWTLSEWNQVQPPFLTCESVLSEACFLLSNFPGASHMIMDMVDLGIIKVRFDISENSVYLSKLLKKYQSVPISLADACLVRMSELIPRSQILTFDRDFRIYRKNGRQTIPLIMPA